MSNGFFNVPEPINEVVKTYKPGSPERTELMQVYNEMKNTQIDIPMFIGGEEVKTGNETEITAPHDHSLKLGTYHRGDKSHVQQAIDAALKAKKEWADLNWEARAGIFLKAADLLAGPYRAKMNAATMLCQSKNAYQAEIDAACEMIDFFRFNVKFMTQLYKEQPQSMPGLWNRLEYRPLE